MSIKIPFLVNLKAISLLVFVVMPLIFSGKIYGQCAATVPTFNVNLTGNPDSTWLSVPTVRNDTCCGAINPDNCVLFIVTLDTQANGIIMDIPEGGGCGARPTGSLFYQVNCGPQIAIGTPVCLNGPGPHYITFCKPGNNANCYQITSFPEPSTSGNTVSQDGCSAQLSAYGYDEASLVWTSVPSNPIHESYLDCQVGCDTVTATYQSGAPAFVDYQVCGSPLGGCDTTPYCDTMRVFFVSAISVEIQPDSPTVCFGAGTTNIWANPLGGAAPYTFQWLDGSSNPVGNTDTIAVGPGTFIVEMTDTLACIVVRDTVVVTEFLSPIQAIPGNDSIICGYDTIPLNGAIQAASGGTWTTGGGTFIPDRNTLNALYVPSPAEYLAGQVSLTLLTTGNGTCPPDSDTVIFTLSPRPDPLPAGPDPVCAFTGGHSYTTPAVAGHSYAWTVSGGNITAGQGTNAINVFWNAAGPGLVTLTQTNPDGCDTTVTFPVTVNPKPTPAIGGAPPLCAWSTGYPYSVTATVGHSYNWVVSGGLISSGQGTAAITVDWGAAGPASVQVTETNTFGCDTTVSIAFIINANPQPAVSGADTVCAWTSGSVYGTPVVPGHSYSWTVTGGTIASGQNTNSISVNWQAAGPASVSVTQTSPAGCDTTFNFPVTILPNPVSTIQGPDNVCQYESGVAYSTAGAPGHGYSWSIAGGSIASGQGTNAVTVNWGAPGNGTLTLVETTALGCDTVATLIVLIAPKPTPAIAGSPALCEFSTGISYSTPNNPGNTYQWTVSGGTIASGQNTNAITVGWGAAGSGTVQVTETNALGCDTTISLSVTIHPTPTPVLSGPATVCAYDQAGAYSTPLNPGHTYAWSVAGGTIVSGQGTGTISVNWGAAGTGTVTLTETSSFGCDTTVTLSVTINPNPQSQITGPDPVCEFDQAAGYSVNAAPGHSYAWTVTGGSIASGQGSNAILVNWGAAGTGNISLTQTTALGCDTTVGLSITIHPRPNPNIVGQDTVCAWSTGAIYATPNFNGLTNTWTVSGGTIVSGQGTSAITVNWGPAGNGTVSVTQSNPLGCDTTETLDVIILPNPATQIAGPDPVCAYSASQYAAVNAPGHSYAWTVSGGTITSGQGSSLIGVTWNGPGTGSIGLLQTTPAGCDTVLNLPVTILSAPIPVLNGPLEACQYSTGHVYSTPPVTGVSYSWSVSGGTITGGQGTASVQVSWDSAGTGVVSLYAQDPSGCDTTIQLPVNLLPGPLAVIEPGDTFGCRFLETMFDAFGSPNAQFFHWDFGNGQTATGPAALATYTQPGNYQVTLIVQNANGCADTAFASVAIAPGPRANFTYTPPSPVNIELDSIEWINNSQFANFYYWNFGDGFLDSVFTPTHQYDTLGDLLVQLIAADTLGCTDTMVRPIQLIIDIDIFVPTAFSPNGDGLNDAFNVVSRNLIDFHVRIFSRWGELIFESFDAEFRWPGTHRGQPCQEGVFVYMIEATGRNNRRFSKSGSVTLIR